MKSLNDYIEDAKLKNDITSNRKLSEILGMGPNAIFHYINKGVFPNDETMIKLAQLGGNDIEMALLDLNIWRTPLSVRSIYENMRHNLRDSIYYGNFRIFLNRVCNKIKTWTYRTILTRTATQNYIAPVLNMPQ